MRQAAWRRVGGVALLIATVCGCSSGADRAPPDGGTFTGRLAAVICDSVSACCTGAGLTHQAAACRQMVVSGLSSRFPSGPGPLVRYDAAAEATCLQATAAAVSACTGPSVMWGVTTEPARSACARVLTGTAAVGEPCSSWGDCDPAAGPVECVTTPSDPRMRCVVQAAPDPVSPRPVLRIGETCQVHSSLEVCFSDCEQGSYCDTAEICVAKRASGTCNDRCASSCTDASYCDLGSESCLPKLPVGAACMSSSSCQGQDMLCLWGACSPALLTLCAE